MAKNRKTILKPSLKNFATDEFKRLIERLLVPVSIYILFSMANVLAVWLQLPLTYNGKTENKILLTFHCRCYVKTFLKKYF